MMDKTELQPGRIKNDGKGQGTHEPMPRIRPEHVLVSLVAFTLYITETGGGGSLRFDNENVPPQKKKTKQPKQKTPSHPFKLFRDYSKLQVN